MRTKIAVSSISPRQSRSGRQYWVVKSDQGTFYVWDASIANVIKAGRQYNVRVDQGEYPRILDLSEPGAPIEASASPTGGSASRSKGEPRRRTELTPSHLELSQYALEKASQLLSRRDDADVGLLLGYAERIRDWLLEKSGEHVNVPPAPQPIGGDSDTDLPF